jgi:predicted nucleic acid-binding protein
VIVLDASAVIAMLLRLRQADRVMNRVFAGGETAAQTARVVRFQTANGDSNERAHDY